jgi:hypothetical protein
VTAFALVIAFAIHAVAGAFLSASETLVSHYVLLTSPVIVEEGVSGGPVYHCSRYLPATPQHRLVVPPGEQLAISLVSDGATSLLAVKGARDEVHCPFRWAAGSLDLSEGSWEIYVGSASQGLGHPYAIAFHSPRVSLTRAVIVARWRERHRREGEPPVPADETDPPLSTRWSARPLGDGPIPIGGFLGTEEHLLIGEGGTGLPASMLSPSCNGTIPARPQHRIEVNGLVTTCGSADPMEPRSSYADPTAVWSAAQATWPCTASNAECTRSTSDRQTLSTSCRSRRRT